MRTTTNLNTFDQKKQNSFTVCLEALPPVMASLPSPASWHCIGGGWDLNVINMFVKHLIPQTLEDQTRAYLASLTISSTSEQRDQGGKFYLLQQESPEAFNSLMASLACWLLPDHYKTCRTGCSCRQVLLA